MGLTNGNPIPSFNFRVFIQMIPISFSKVTSIEYQVDTEPLKEGGVNNYVHCLMKPCQNEKKMVFEKGMCSDLKMLATGRFTVGSKLNMPVLIFVNDSKGFPHRIYELSGAFIKKFSSSDLDAKRGDVLIEKVEIVYDNIEEISVPLAGTISGLL